LDSERNKDVDTDIRPKSSHKFKQGAFHCMHANGIGSSQDAGPNARTLEILGEMGRYYDRINDNWRTLAYRKAVSALKICKTRISTKAEALKINGIGDRIATKIEEIVTTNNLRRLESTKDDPVDKALQIFTGIYGVGFNRAQQWVNAGHRTLEDIRTKVQLTEFQTVGLEHYDDFSQRIPRAEVEQHGAMVRDALKAIDSKYEVTVMGSFRRGARDSGDIDIIFTKPHVSASVMRSTVMLTLIPRLFNAGFLKANLTTPRSDSSSKWHGASCIPGSTAWRRIDFLLVPWAERGAALLYFTGNDIFNRSIRLLARKKGMRLNQRGLYRDVMRGKGGLKMTEGELLEGESEKRILEIMGVPWRPPQDRNC
jgi:DNA polymerase IV